MWTSTLFALAVGLTLTTTLEAATLTSSIQNSIETRVIVDRWEFNSWKSKVATSAIESKRNVETKTALVDYINSAFHDLNSIFKGMLSSGINLDARIVSIEFITDEDVTSESPSGSGQGKSENVLEEFKTWLATKSYDPTDHTMLLTGLDLTKGGDTSNAGVAYVGEMCSSLLSLSVSEGKPSGSVVLTMAHELGHNMNSDHDGSSCGEGYIMEASSSGGSSTNTFRYSSCSIASIKAYLQSLHNSGSCLSGANTATAADSSIALGERYTPDQICQLNEGSSSYLCRTLYGYNGGKDYGGICSYIYCSAGDGDCNGVRGSDGFVCGQGKICSLGQCVSSSSAPTTVSDTCPQGDTDYPMNDAGQTCSQALSALPGNCYQDFYRRGCCAGCQSASTGTTGCEYGDKSSSCSPLTFPFACNAGNNADTCCGSCSPHKTGVAGCEYGDKASWCGTNSYPPKDCYYGNDASCCGSCPALATGIEGCEYGDTESWCADYIAQDINNCAQNSEACCKSCQNYGSGNSGSSSSGTSVTCVDQSSQCASAIPANPALCYTNEELCCASCAKVVSGTGSCKYGDAESWCADYIAQDINNCAQNSEACCKSCQNYGSGNSGSSSSGTSVTCVDQSSQCASAIPANPALCYTNEDVCCASCAKVVSGTGNCKYGDRSTDCATLSYPRTCYTNEDVCCGSCAQYDTGNAACKYGVDRYSGCTTGHCSAHAAYCCATCG